MNPKVSIIVPVYNCEKYLSSCIESILGQTYSNFEIIIINDGSTDRSELIIDNYREKDRRIVYFSQQNSGPSEARNKGILNSIGDYLVFIDADDTVDENYIQLLLNRMIDSNTDLVCCGYKDISAYGLVNHTDFKFTGTVSQHAFIDMVFKGTGGVLWGKIFKRDLIIKYKLKFDKDIFMSEDLVFVLQYVSHCSSFTAMKEYLYYYNRLNQNSISSNISMEYLENYTTVCRHLEKILYDVNLDEEKINRIISKRVQDIVVKLVEQQGTNIKDIGFRNAIHNVKIVFSIQDFGKYKENFSSDCALYKLFIFLVKNKMIITIIIYGFILHLMKCFKNKLNKERNKKQVRF